MDLVEEDFAPSTQPTAQASSADFLLHEEKALPTLFSHGLGQGTRQGIGRRTLDRRIGKAANAIELGAANKVEQFGKLCLGLAGKADDEGAAQGEIRHLPPPLRNAVEGAICRRRAPHGAQNARAAVLQGYVEVGEDFARGHQG